MVGFKEEGRLLRGCLLGHIGVGYLCSREVCQRTSKVEEGRVLSAPWVQEDDGDA